jgi:predicted dehydrogenase
MNTLNSNSKKSNRPLRGAMLGCGHIAPFHLRAWAQIKGAEIVALANRTVSKAEARAQEFGIPLEHVYQDYRELLAREELDFVDIATAPHIHRQQVEAAAAHGRHVLCQKPFAPTLKDARAMIAACEQAGVLYSINENWRWRSWYRDVKHLLEEGVVGRPKYVRLTKHSDAALPTPAGGHGRAFVEQSYMADMDKLILYEYGVHHLDVLRFLFGEVTSIYARTDRVSPLYRGEDRALVTLEVGGVTGLVDLSWATVSCRKAPPARTHLETVIIEGDKGIIELLPHQGGILRVTTKSETWQRPAFDCTPDEAYQASFTAAQRHFVECLQEGRSPETVASDNLKTLAATFAAYESAAQNQVVLL